MEIHFDNPLNTSIQIGDIAYYADASGMQGAFNVGSNLFEIGEITDIYNGHFTATDPITGITHTSQSHIVVAPIAGFGVLPATNAFIMFRKNNVVNKAGLVGYYAEVTLMNNSQDKAELFSISSDAVESSK